MSESVVTPRPLQLGAKGAYIVRLLMVGDSACGKTSLVLRFDQNVFSTKFVTTIGVDYRDKMVKVRKVWGDFWSVAWPFFIFRCRDDCALCHSLPVVI